MCIIPSEHCHHSTGSVTESARSALVVVAGLAVTAAAYAAFRVLWVPLGLAIAVGWVAAYRTPRRIAARTLGLTAVGALAAGRWLYRRTRPAAEPSREVAVPREYRATLYQATPAGNRVIRRGPVPGVWADPAEVAREVRDRYIAMYAPTRPELLRVHVEPITDGAA